jgi:RHH-type rel operon transcriptional repressor/antitoxin RelB
MAESVEYSKGLNYLACGVILVIQEADMLAVRLDPSTEDKLTNLAQETGRSKSYYVRQAIESFLEEREDYLLALAVLERNEPRKSLSEMRKELGLER